MYNHILIPTDGSELSTMALEEGIALAKALGARVTVVTVTTPFHVCVQPVNATPLVVYRLAFGSPRSFADVD